MSADFLTTMPDSIRSYLSDNAVEGAVDHLLNVKKDGLPDGLEWADYERFLAARAAAHLTRAEYPIAIWNFWKHVWQDSVGSEWLRPTPDETGADLIGPLTSWKDETIALLHNHIQIQGLM